MKKFWLSVTLAFLLPATSLSQNIKPSPKPTPPVDGDVVKISTNLIRIDVTVTDGKGAAIPNLRPDEIEIYENGEKQKITSLSFVSAGVRVPVAKIDRADKNIPVPQTPLKPDQIRRTIGLVVDDLSLSFESASLTRRALKNLSMIKCKTAIW